MDDLPFETPLAAFIAGIFATPHCTLMCGPLVLALMQGKGKTLHQIQASYQICRILSLSLVGGIAGAIGKPMLGFLKTPPSRIFPWIIAALFLIMGLGLERFVPKPRFMQSFFQRYGNRIRALPRPLSSGLLGLLTPLLPCGPLYLAFMAAFFTGSIPLGTSLLFFFALGGSLFLWGIYFLMAHWKQSCSHQWFERIQKGLFLGAGVLMIVRLLWIQVGTHCLCSH